MRINARFFAGAVLAVLSVAAVARAEDTSAPIDEPFAEHPTLHCLGTRWKIRGDANQNAEIAVSYRKAGDADWKQGYPLFRTKPNPHPENKSAVHTVQGGWMFAGSVFGLTPDTEYEVKLNLKDPDGGEAEKILKMKTWKEPEEPKGMTVLHVQPGEGGGTGTEADPFKGSAAALAAAKPGTLFLFHKGTYQPFGVGVNGEEGKPIIFRGAGDGEAIIDGGGDFDGKGQLVGAKDRKHLWFEDLTLQGAHYAINANGSSNFVIRRCKFRKAGKGFNCQNGGYNQSVRHFIVDNDIIGPTTWPRTKGIESYCFTYMSGGGHVVAYNRMYNVGDAMHGTGHGSWSACDVYNNDMNICTDDGIETDHCEFNIRVWGNRIRNVAHGITAQPSRGGPVYIFRNFIYSCTYSPFKLHNHTTGVLLLHNTCFKMANAFNIVPAQETVTNIWTRNNLFMTSKGWGISVGTNNAKECNFDSDGFGGFTSGIVSWSGGKRYKTPEEAKAGGIVYKEAGAYVINPDTCFASGLKAPANEDKEYTIEELDFRLGEKSEAIDKGVVLPNINDGFKGKAPDLGALEFGEAMPHFGPREKK